MVGKLQAEEEPGLLLVDADRREPTLTAAVAVRTTRGQAVPPGPERGYLWHEQDRPNDLVAQRWGVIAPEGPEGDELLAAIEPLIKARGEQQQAAVKVYRVPAQMSPATAASWKREVFHRSERLRQDLPRYQLLLGDLHQVPETLQISQATDGFVGRLAFDAVADYADYCAKILAAEAAPAPGPRQALFHGVADGTAATEAGIRGLVRPCVALAREMQSREAGLFPATIVASEDAEPDPASFRGAAGAAQVLLSLSHGEGAPRGGWRSPAEQRARQGAMSFGAEADDLAGAALLRGPIAPLGLWLMFACFSAGTPSTSKYARWIERLIAEGRAGGRPEQVLQCLPGPGEPPFVAAIPKAALRNRRPGVELQLPRGRRRAAALPAGALPRHAGGGAAGRPGGGGVSSPVSLVRAGQHGADDARRGGRGPGAAAGAAVDAAPGSGGVYAARGSGGAAAGGGEAGGHGESGAGAGEGFFWWHGGDADGVGGAGERADDRPARAGDRAGAGGLADAAAGGAGARDQRGRIGAAGRDVSPRGEERDRARVNGGRLGIIVDRYRGPPAQSMRRIISSFARSMKFCTGRTAWSGASRRLG